MVIFFFSAKPVLADDWSDAPSGYGTAQHTNNATTLRMGANFGDTEGAALSSANADGDDLTGTDDEDGVASFPSLNTLTTTYSVNVNVVNNYTSFANLRGWIDFDDSGTFDTDEASGNVTANVGTNGNLTLTWNNIGGTGPNIVAGNTFVRIRLATSTLNTNNATGSETRGEVEDYPLTINPPPPTVTITKVSNGGTGTFTFTGDNGYTSTNITTATSGVGVAGTTRTLTASSTATTLTESAPPGNFALTGITCTGLGSGGTYTPNLAARSVLLDAAATAAGSAIACTFTNTNLSVTVTKISNGGVGSFTFTGTNGYTSTNITTVTSGVGVDGTTRTLTAAGTATTITESAPPAGFVLTGITCSGLGSGGTATPNIASRNVVLDAAATAAGSAIECTFTNETLPTVTVTKISNGGVGSFTFTGTNGYTSTNITTVTSGVGVAGTTRTLTAPSIATTITESAPPAGFVLTGITCSGLGSGGTYTPNLVTRSVLLDAAATATGSAIACTFTNNIATLTKSFSPSSITSGNSSTLSLIINNSSGNPAFTGIGFTDTLPVSPGNMRVYSTPNILTNCPAGGSIYSSLSSGVADGNGQTVTAPASGATVVLAGMRLNSGVSSCEVRVDITANTAGNYTNDSTRMSGISNIDVSATMATLAVIQPTLTKSFSPSTINTGGQTSTLSLLINNAPGNPARTGISLTDTLPVLPAAMTVKSTPNIRTNCPVGGSTYHNMITGVADSNGQTVTAAASSGSVALSNMKLNSGVISCEVLVDVTAGTTGTYVNDSTRMSGTSGINTSATTATLTVTQPTLTKLFTPSTINMGGQVSTLKLTINNSTGNPSATGIALTDTLPVSPANMRVFTTPNIRTNCPDGGAYVSMTSGSVDSNGQTVTAPGNSATIALAAMKLNSGVASCDVLVDVTAGTLGSYVNNTARMSSTSNINVSATTATLTVSQPTLTKSFSPIAIIAGQTSTLILTLNNSSGSPTATGIGLTDTLPVSPSNMRVFTTPNIRTNCPDGGSTYTSMTSGTPFNGQTVTAPANSATVVLAGMKINSGVTSCDVMVDISTAGTIGNYVNDAARMSGNTNLTTTGVSATLAVTTPSIVGTVFEDVNYGGGAGRSLSGSSGVGRPNVRVELFNNAGNFVSFATTNASGQYSFAVAAGNYTVRVVNSSVKSSRTGTSSEVGVQTFRTNATSGAAVAVTNYVGGQNPTVTDAGNAGAGSTMNRTTGVFTAGITGTAQSITSVTMGTTNITSVDFGFNFDTIVNTNDTGQGSLRQFINNSNLLGNAGLSQVGQTSGREVSIFMIPNGVANAGQNTSYANQLTTYGAARITIAGVLPTVTDSNTSIDGSTQTTYVRASSGAETNPGQVGSAGNVGVSQAFLQKFNNTEVEISATNIRDAIVNTGTYFQLKNIAVSGAMISIRGNNSLAQDNLIGMRADGTETGTIIQAWYAIEAYAGTDNIIFRHNYVKADNSAIRRDDSGSNWLVEYNEVDRPSAGQSNTYDGILIIGGGLNDTIQYNLIKNMRGSGSELGYNAGANVVNLVVQENTYTNNGFLIDGVTPSLEPINLDVRTIGSGSVIKIYRNIIANSGGIGVYVDATNRVWVTQNSIFNNGKVAGRANLGIDLDDTDSDPNTLGTNLDGVTPNDGITSPTGRANSGMDYPIITSAIVSGPQVRVQGYVGSAPGQSAFGNSTLEFFKALDDGNNNGPIILGDGLNVSHGEGKEFIGTCLADANASFDCTFYNQNVLPGQIITATATNTNFDTSEFSNLTLTTDIPPQFFPNNSSNALPGATIYFPHKYIASVPGTVTLSMTSSNGWIYSFFNDVNGNSLLDAGDTLYSGSNPSLGDVYNLYPTHSVNLLVKVQVPSNTPTNTTETLNLTATLNISPAKVLAVSDIITVSTTASGPLKLIKSVSPSGSQPPGTNLTFTVTYTNIGSSNLSEITIADIVPSFTNFISATAGGTYSATTGKVTWVIPGTLGSGVSGSVQFIVQIQ